MAVQKWEYTVVAATVPLFSGDKNPDYSKLEPELNNCGNDGWELVHIFEFPKQLDYQSMKLVLKRQKQE
jgi:hypothetical protein